ncbi:uncharacterized protein BP5553_01124 [Venustampulla echinocandica]|uniref:Uncharacterized protein n=1 Tax=Venustampulla echinocandica TaxID=2656787 RepID=A0A370U054_9HELO|nr:uncharacterized protein BP5553_01124 [Venustampulla echinocandica]RDL41145.1 hypothetical protein BP5553_01124 [Venustampulla echinocandica]
MAASHTNSPNRNSASSFSSTHSNQSNTSTHSTSSEKQQCYLISTASLDSHADAQVDLDAETWKEPYTIDDADLTFDGKPLNMLHEENRYYAEHGYGGEKEGSRGRSRRSKK